MLMEVPLSFRPIPIRMSLSLLALLSMLVVGCGKSSKPSPQAEPVNTSVLDDAPRGSTAPRLVAESPLLDGGREVRHLTFLGDSNYVLTHDGTLAVWRFDPGAGSVEELAWFGWAEDRKRPTTDYTDLDAVEAYKATHIPVLAYAASGDGRYVVGGSSDGRLGLWELTPQEPSVARKIAELATGAGAIAGVAITPDGRRIAVTANHSEPVGEVDGEEARTLLQVWNLTPDRAPYFERVASHPLAEVGSAVVITPSGRTAITHGDVLAVVTVEPDGTSRVTYSEHKPSWKTASLTHGGDVLVTANMEVKVSKITDTQTLELVAAFAQPEVRFYDVAVAPDDLWLAVVSVTKNTLYLWPFPTAARPAPEPIVHAPHVASLAGVAIHANGRYVATGGYRLRVWAVDGVP